MVRKYMVLIIIILLMLFNGCAHYLSLRLEDEYLQQGKQSEANDDQVSALRFYKLAITVDPYNQEAQTGRRRMEKALRDSAERHYITGLKLNEEGQYAQARKHFLIALHLWPDNPEIIKILTERKRVRIKGYVLHTIKSGESLAKIAERYYGDQRKFSIIAEYNNLTDATRIHEGQEIKVPEVVGLEFLADKENVEKVNPEDHLKETVDALIEKALADRVNDCRKRGIRLFKENRYGEAIDEFKKVLSIAHSDGDSLEYIQKAYYNLGMDHFKKKDYYAAMDQFRASIQYRDECTACVEYLQKSEELYKELHYKKGMQYYESEQLVNAINEWELVTALDPDYKRAGYHIDKAKVMLKKLEEIKNSRKQGK